VPPRPALPALVHAILLAPGILRAQAAGSPAWLQGDGATRTVEVRLTAAPAPAGPAINGEREGGVQLVVPRGWTVKWTWVNGDSAARHSLVVMQEREKLPSEAGRPAFTNAVTRQPLAGMEPGRTDVTTFVAEDAGWYWLLCGVPGHAIAGEYLGLKVDAEATAPSLVRTRPAGP